MKEDLYWIMSCPNNPWTELTMYDKATYHTGKEHRQSTEQTNKYSYKVKSQTHTHIHTHTSKQKTELTN